MDSIAGIIISVRHTSSTDLILPNDKYNSRQRFTALEFIDTEDTKALSSLLINESFSNACF